MQVESSSSPSGAITHASLAILRLGVMLVVALWTHDAAAQCASDAECKGERQCVDGACADVTPTCRVDLDCAGDQVCTEGACVAPGSSSPGVAIVREPRPTPIVSPMVDGGSADPGWAHGAAVTGYVGTGVVAISTIVAIVFTVDAQDARAYCSDYGYDYCGEEDSDNALIAGATATVLTGVLVPVVAAGGASARESEPVEGLPGARSTGWILYGLALANATTLIGLGAADVDLGDAYAPLTASTGLLGVTSLVLFSTDALLSGSDAEARAVAERAASASTEVELGPMVSTLRSADGSVGGIFGVSGRF